MPRTSDPKVTFLPSIAPTLTHNIEDLFKNYFLLFKNHRLDSALKRSVHFRASELLQSTSFVICRSDLSRAVI
jgi:hypothetical protein